MPTIFRVQPYLNSVQYGIVLMVALISQKTFDSVLSDPDSKESEMLVCSKESEMLVCSKASHRHTSHP